MAHQKRKSMILMPDRIIGVRVFSDGTLRNVFEDARGQYVLTDDGHKVRGSWIVSEEDPPLPAIDQGESSAGTSADGNGT
jgi:hypothetical protein